MSSTIKSAPGSEPRLRDPESLELGLVGVQGVVVPDADGNSLERSAAYELEDVADEDLRPRDPEVGEIRLQRLEAGVAKPEVVDSHEPSLLVPEHGRDQAGAMEDADLDVDLVGLETGRREVQ